MMQAAHILMAMLAVWRITELFTLDRISFKLRQKYPIYLWTCPRCLSVWASVVATVAFVYFPWFNWPFALAYVYLWHIEDMTMRRLRKSRQLIIETDANGQARLVRSELTPAELQQFMAQVVKNAA